MHRPRSNCLETLRLLMVALLLAWGPSHPAWAGNGPPIRVGSEIQFQPYSDVDAQGEASGFAVELFAATARAADIPFNIQSDKWDRVWNGLLQGNFDALPVVARLPEREGLVEFTRPHTIGFDAFFVRQERPPISTIHQARSLRIMVMRSDAAHHALASRGFEGQLVFVDTLAEGLRLLAAGHHDALLAPVLQGNMLLQSLGLTKAIESGPPLKEYRREFAFAVRKGNHELQDRLDKGLAMVKENGEYDALYRKWLGIYEPPTFPRAYLRWGMAGALAVFGFLALWTLLLRRQVALRTAELSSLNETLQASFKEIDELYQKAPCGFFSLAEDGAILGINDTGLRLLGYSREELAGRKKLQDLMPPESRLLFIGNLASPADPGQANDLELELTRKDGAGIPVLVHVSVIRNDDGQFVACRTMVYDMTERRQAQARLQLSASVFTHSRDGITLTDANGIIVDVNHAFTRITGYSREEVLGRNPRLLKSGRHGKEYYQAMWQALAEQGYWSGEIWNRRKDGEIYAEMITISAVCDGAGEVRNYVGLFSDITVQKDHQQQLEHIAHYDPLTALPNRVLLADRLQQALAHSKRQGRFVAVAYLDLDGFKAINDQHGHEVGDDLLVALAQRMKDCLRQVDTLARLGGDEFVGVLVDLEEARDCEPLLARMLQAASELVPVGDLRLRVSASIGATIYPTDGADPDQLLRHADQAMYLAKQAGKNRYHLFDVIQDEAAKTRHESLEHIRRALDADEFVLYYQPKVNMRTGAVVGAEALIRWQHPERGLLLPGAFLPAIENHPISLDLGEWVIRTALAQVSAWQRQGFAPSVSVNIGARQLQQPDFLERLQSLLAAYPEVSASQLELEVLETSALEDMSHVSRIVRACQELGLRFALDDFGTGYSSLIYLKRLPADILKIDQNFVRDILEDPEDRAIVAGVVGLAKAFQRTVIAEGVETAEHGRLIMALGCDLAQGYGIARPMPGPEVPKWADAWPGSDACAAFRANLHSLELPRRETATLL